MSYNSDYSGDLSDVTELSENSIISSKSYDLLVPHTDKDIELNNINDNSRDFDDLYNSTVIQSEDITKNFDNIHKRLLELERNNVELNKKINNLSKMKKSICSIL
jgi:hypothetical protein